MSFQKSRLIGKELWYLQSILGKIGAKITSLEEPLPAGRAVIENWEQIHAPLKLPTDLSNLYSICNGWLLTWESEKNDGKQFEGALSISSLSQLRPITSNSRDPDLDYNLPPGATAAFVLDDVSGLTCLTFRQGKWEVWAMDYAMDWYFVASSVTDYFRSMLVHVGVNHWQMHFAHCGLPIESKFCLKLLAPSILEDDVEEK